MKTELTEKLYNDFPDLYEQRSWSIQDSCMAWGFECGDGWYDLIYQLSKDLMAVSDKVRAVQVKEKYGGLRFYFTYSDHVSKAVDKKVFSLISKAEKESYKICEHCGSRDNVKQTQGWIVTLCGECMEKRMKERQNT
jgi:hypothetical protein